MSNPRMVGAKVGLVLALVFGLILLLEIVLIGPLLARRLNEEGVTASEWFILTLPAVGCSLGLALWAKFRK
jgi:hypothetical protein